MALDGLGENVANKIIEEREKKPFYCVEDFQNRGKANPNKMPRYFLLF